MAVIPMAILVGSLSIGSLAGRISTKKKNSSCSHTSLFFSHALTIHLAGRTARKRFARRWFMILNHQVPVIRNTARSIMLLLHLSKDCVPVTALLYRSPSPVLRRRLALRILQPKARPKPQVRRRRRRPAEASRRPVLEGPARREETDTQPSPHLLRATTRPG